MPSKIKHAVQNHNAPGAEDLGENTYHDYSDEVDVENNESDTSQLVKRTDHPFPVRLHFMLEEIEKDGNGSIISWQHHGRCFVVHRRKEFVEKILPLWFVQSKYTSFQRQLNLYGFRRLTSGRDKGGIYHEMFLRGKMFLSKRIQRTVYKGRGSRRPASPETEPNFYLMRPCVSSTVTPVAKLPQVMKVSPYPLMSQYVSPSTNDVCLNNLLLGILNSSPMVQCPSYLDNHARARAMNRDFLWLRDTSLLSAVKKQNNKAGA